MSAEVRRSRAHLRLIVFLARRSLFSSKVTLVLLALAIAAGAGFQIPNSANLDAFETALLEESLTHGAGDVRVEPRSSARFDDGDALASTLRSYPGVRDVIPVLMFPGAVGVNGRFLGTPIYGIDQIADPPFQITEGGPLRPGDKDGILIGNAYAKRLNVRVGDPVEVRVIYGAAGTAIDEDNTGAFTMTVRGIVSGSAGAYRFCFLDRSFLGAESGSPKGASMALVHLHDHGGAGAVAAEIERKQPDLRAIAWREDDPWLPNYLDANRTISKVSYGMVIAAVSVPMWALLYIHVLKRRREIAILSALGFGRREVFWMFLAQAMFVAVIGCVIGSVLGYGAIRYFQANPLFRWETMVVRPLAAIGTFLVPAGIVTLTALVAGSYPAWRAARTHPATVLRRLE